MLIAEDLLLLLTDDRTGKLLAPSNQVDIALGGALLVELALAHRVEVVLASTPPRRRRARAWAERKKLDSFPTQDWPANDTTHENSVRVQLVDALREGVARRAVAAFLTERP